jgi:hypothetical protein
MKAVIKQLFIPPLRFVARQILQRPGLKRRVRSLIMRMPRLYGLLMRVMFHAPAPVRRKVSARQQQLSPAAQRVYRALQQAMRDKS